MKSGKIPWLRHQNDQSILSIDIQPNSYRFVTGGGDSAVCVWNLLPVIGEEFERRGNPQKPEEDIDMAQNSQNSQSSDQSDSDPESRERFEQREKDIEKDVQLMESLF